MKLKFLAALSVSILLLVGGACGGDDESDTTSADEIGTVTDEVSATPTKAEFIAEADQICRAGNDELDAEANKLGADPTQAQKESFASDVLVPGVQDQIDSIRALGAPEGDEDEVEELLDEAQSGVDALEEDPSLITSDDDPFTEANDLAADYGLKVCSE